MLTAAQNEQYFRVRLDPFKLRHSKGMEHRAVCPLHGGSNPSQLWVDIAEGNWCCFSCGAKGGSAFAFEQAFLKAERHLSQAPPADDIVASLEAILETPFVQRVYPEDVTRSTKGPEQSGWDRRHARDSYRYTDELGNEVLTVWRFVDRNGSKITPADRPCPCGANPDAECGLQCVNGRTWVTKGARRVLYRLPSVIGAQLVFVVEGEKNANDLSRALAEYVKRRGGFPLTESQILDHVAVTTNPGGARGWKPAYGFGRYFAGKVVIKLGDNDAPGRAHDHDACTDIAPHALSTFTLALPVGEGEDISDFLATHSIDDLLKLLPTRKEWSAPKPNAPVVTDTVAPRPLLVRPSELVRADASRNGDWLVDGLIERGTRGLVVAPPKTGKSLLFLEMVLCLANRQSFLGKAPYHRAIKCAVISREDGPGMVHRRLTQLAKSRGLTMHDIDRNLLVNTEDQSTCFKIDRPQDLEEMAGWLKSEGVEFCVIDVLNRLHDQQENHSDDMTRVMQRFDELAQRAGCQVCVIHHTNKAGGVKGSTAIEGWADYVVRLEQSPEDESVKRLFIKTKSSGTIPARTIRYWQSEDQSESRIGLVRQRMNDTVG
jgi:KaiC/GvpD/RAD55 family RecA-like ATPase